MILTEETVTAPPSQLRRAGCIITLVIWFVILLLPCFLIVLGGAAGDRHFDREARRGSRFAVWLISEADRTRIGDFDRPRHADCAGCCLRPDECAISAVGGEADPAELLRLLSSAPTRMPQWSSTSTTNGACSG